MDSSHEPAREKTDLTSDETSEPAKVVSTEELFAGQREICIEHAGEKYRLRITRRNKLILQK